MNKLDKSKLNKKSKKLMVLISILTFVAFIILTLLISSKAVYAIRDLCGEGCDPCYSCEVVEESGTKVRTCVWQCGSGQVCYGGSCCTPRTTCSSGECGIVDDGCGGGLDCGKCPSYWTCSGDRSMYFKGLCINNGCEYTVTEEKNCNNYDNWYCSGENGREYRDYTCDKSNPPSCTYTVTETQICPSSAPFCCDSDNNCHECCTTDDCQATFGYNYFCNKSLNCECSPEEKEELGAECGPDGCNPQGFGLCDSNKECIENFCVDKKDFRTIVGYLNIVGHNGKEILVESTPYDSYQKSSAGQYCSKLNEWFFKNEKCNNKNYNECGGLPLNDDTVEFQVSNYEWNNQNVKISCDQKGPIDGWCDGTLTNPYSLTIKLCDPKSGISCPSDDYYIDLERLGLDINCVYLDEEQESNKNCESENKLILRAVNNYKPCDESGENVCIMGRCTRYVCYQNNKIDAYEMCDPVVTQKYNISGTEVNESEITCSLVWMSPKDNDISLKPSCQRNCIINTQNCEQLSSLCGNQEINARRYYSEVCDFREEPLTIKTLKGDEVKITEQFKGKHTCSEKEGYIGDATYLSCKGCLTIGYENCEQEPVDEEGKHEKECKDGLNEDYWYDLYVPEGKDRKKYIIDNYIGDDGLFVREKIVFDTDECFNETVCHDCYDIDCDGKSNSEGKICNFKRERMCNDGFDNDGDGLVDGEDSEDCKFERYNPELSTKGHCRNSEECFNTEECLSHTNKSEVGDKLVICNLGEWVSPIKSEANLMYENAKNKNNFTLYCNDFGDASENKGYVISLESEIPAGGYSVKEFMKSYSGYLGKFCAFKSNEDYALSTRIKGLEYDPARLRLVMQLFSLNPDSCSKVGDESTTKMTECEENISINKVYGIVIKTNEDIKNKQILNTNIINEKIKELGEEYLQTIGISRFVSENLWRGSLTEALTWKKSNEKELFGIIETINGTTYAVILIKNIGKAFENSCSVINSQRTIEIGSITGQCTKINNDFIIYWVIHKDIPGRESLIKQSLDKFDQLVKEIRIS